MHAYIAVPSLHEYRPPVNITFHIYYIPTSRDLYLPKYLRVPEAKKDVGRGILRVGTLVQANTHLVSVCASMHDIRLLFYEPSPTFTTFETQ